jgi:O-antigen ligase
MLKIGWLQFVFVHIFSGFSNEFIASKIFTYTDTYESGRGFSANTIASIIFYVSTFILCLYYRLNLEGKNKYFNMFLNIYMCQVVSYFALYEFIEMADRLRLYFLIANLILLPSMVFVFISLKERVLIYTYLIAFAFFSCKPYVLNEQVTIAYHPYQNFIIYNLFDLKSTGAERLDEHARIHEE